MKSVEFEPDVFEIWPENELAKDVFCHCTTQWYEDKNGRLKGIRYHALESVMRMLRIRDRAEVFADVRVMEFAVLESINQGT